MDREKIMDDLEDLQHKTDAMGFVGSNEHDLWLREAIADYVVKLFAIPDVRQQSEQLSCSGCKYNGTYDSDLCLTCGYDYHNKTT